jgi:hypothetical protein
VLFEFALELFENLLLASEKANQLILTPRRLD